MAARSRARAGAPPVPRHPVIRVGISSCLLGEEVRWDGGHKKDPFLTDLLGAHFQWVAVCPELEVGMGVPREPVRLIGSEQAPRMVGLKSARDWTDAMLAFSRSRVGELEELDLCGFILKKDSPSCGMERVRVHSGKGAPSRKGTGLFARELMRGMPLLPVEEEGRLRDPVLRENFIERIFAFRRLKDLLGSGCRRADLVMFHTVHKFLLLSHSRRHYQELGRIVAGAKAYGRKQLGEAYGARFMEALRIPATVKGHFNVLQHLAGHLKRILDAQDKREMAEVLDDYRRGLVPLIVPLTLLKHHVARQGVEYVRNQVYLNPHPRELMLRNHV